jgi:leucine dehydrogenase
MTIFDGDFEGIYFRQNENAGLRMIIALHDLTLGDALGGIRFYPYESEEEALIDAKRLAKGMTYKNAIIYRLSQDEIRRNRTAGKRALSHGGGKSVIIGNPKIDKKPRLLQAAAEAINEMGGRYIGGEDMGMSSYDVALMFEKTFHVTGLKETYGRGGRKGSGDPSPITALGTFEGIRECLIYRFGSSWMGNKRFAIQGVGNVGKVILDYLADRGAKIIATDVDAQAIQVAKISHPEVEILDPENSDEIYDQECDVFVPCARGGIINDDTIPRLEKAGIKIVAGCANNQLLEPRHGEELRSHGILYAPDYVINAGGAINVALEIEPRGYDPKRARDLTMGIGPLIRQIFLESGQKNIPPERIADQMAERVLEHAREGINL